MTLLELLSRHTPFDAHEVAMLAQLRDFLASLPNLDDAFGREVVGSQEGRGHVTGSAWIVNQDASRVVMLFHGKLNKWVQSGGHCDGDRDALRVALREAREETGLDVSPVSRAIFDVDAHLIPEYWNTPAHTHYDVRFLLRADSLQPPVVSSESKAVRWVTLDEAATLNGSASIARMIAKTRRLETQQTLGSVRSQMLSER